MKISFYIRKHKARGSIYINCYFNSKAVVVFIEQTVLIEHWDLSKQRTNNDPYINAYIDDLEVECYRIARHYKMSGNKNIDSFRDDLKRLVKRENYTPLIDLVSTPTLIKYHNQVEFVELEFFNFKNRIDRYVDYVETTKIKTRLELVKIRSLLSVKSIPFNDIYFEYLIDRLS